MLFLVIFLTQIYSGSIDNYIGFCANKRHNSEIGKVYKITFDHSDKILNNGFYFFEKEIQPFERKIFYNYTYIAVPNEKTKDYDLFIYSELTGGTGYQNVMDVFKYIIKSSVTKEKPKETDIIGKIESEGLCASLKEPERGGFKCISNISFLSSIKNLFTDNSPFSGIDQSFFQHKYASCILVDNNKIDYQGLYADGLQYIGGEPSLFLLVEKSFKFALNVDVLLKN